MISDFKNKKVLIMGLGLLGGGVSSAKWFVKNGAQVTVTDLKSKEKLLPSIKKLGKVAKKIKFILGRHNENDFKKNDYIVVNPDIRRESKFLAVARKAKKKLINDAVVFFNEAKNPTIAVTGTRGKTTTVNWLHYFLKTKYPRSLVGGNSSIQPLLSLLNIAKDKNSPLVVELSSWQLELLPQTPQGGADIAIITNIYPDHLNRYNSIKDYASAKANIFKYQKSRQKLILNYDNNWTKYFLKQNPPSELYFFSAKSLPENKKGIFVQNDSIRVRDKKELVLVPSKDFNAIKKWGMHNIMNLLPSLLVACFFDIAPKNILRKLKTLPQIKYRQELLMQKKNLMIINDSAATSPDATIAALRRFQNKATQLILITGGTDKNLEFQGWAMVVKKYIKPENLFLLNGTATQKMLAELKKINYFRKSPPQSFENLQKLLLSIKKLPITNYQLPITILFSPSSASFEKFQNEFDRGEQFNLYSQQIFK